MLGRSRAELKDLRAHKGRKALLDLRGLRGLRVRPDPLALLGCRVKPVLRVQLVRLVLQDCLDRSGHKDRLEMDSGKLAN